MFTDQEASITVKDLDLTTYLDFKDSHKRELERRITEILVLANYLFEVQTKLFKFYDT